MVFSSVMPAGKNCDRKILWAVLSGIRSAIWLGVILLLNELFDSDPKKKNLMIFSLMTLDQLLRSLANLIVGPKNLHLTLIHHFHLGHLDAKCILRWYVWYLKPTTSLKNVRNFVSLATCCCYNKTIHHKV